MTTRAAAICCVWFVGCGFDDLDRAPPPEDELDTLEGGVDVGGILVAPAVIHPGDRVTMLDPIRPRPGDPAPLYLWDACGGAFESLTYGRETTWIAPGEPGAYAIAINVANAVRDLPSRVISLCVVGEGDGPCAEPQGAAPVLETLTASPGFFVQETDCPGSCRTRLDAEVVVPEGVTVEYLWALRGGDVAGAGPSVEWLLPTVGCCTESYAAAVTVCGDNAHATTGFTSVVVSPG